MAALQISTTVPSRPSPGRPPWQRPQTIAAYSQPPTFHWFTPSPPPNNAQIDSLKTIARNAGRNIQSWIHVYVVCRDTEKESQDYLDYYVREKGDCEAVNNLLKIFEMNSEMLPAEVLEQFRFHFIAGHGGYPLVGTPEKIVDEMNKLIQIGVDGVLISWVDYKTEAKQWIDEVLPLMEQAGQRAPKPMVP